MYIAVYAFSLKSLTKVLKSMKKVTSDARVIHYVVSY